METEKKPTMDKRENENHEVSDEALKKVSGGNRLISHWSFFKAVHQFFQSLQGKDAKDKK